METMYDAIILGGGPAGSTAATLLARAGRRAVVLEKEKFPRFHIGESLLPISMEAFERLGVREKLDARFIIKHGGEIGTTCGAHCTKFYFKEGLEAPAPTSYHVTRAEFDKILLDHAREEGAEVREETTVERVDFDGEGATVKLAGGEVLRGRYVVDASGRHSLLGTQFGLKETYPHLQKFAIYAHYENVDREPGINGTLIRIIRGKDRWFWMIPLTETRMSIGVVLDVGDFKRFRQPPEKFLEQAIAEQPVIMEAMGRASLASQVYASGDYSYRNKRLAGDRWLLAGDAAGFIDPVFSTGVFIALLSGEQAADAIGIALAAPRRGPHRFRGYERNLHKIMDRYLRIVSAWYSPEFIEVFVRPETRFRLPQAINSILGGNLTPSWAVRWRLELFYLILKIQKRFPLCPKLELTPGAPQRPAATVSPSSV